MKDLLSDMPEITNTKLHKKQIISYGIRSDWGAPHTLFGGKH